MRTEVPGSSQAFWDCGFFTTLSESFLSFALFLNTAFRNSCGRTPGSSGTRWVWFQGNSQTLIGRVSQGGTSPGPPAAERPCGSSVTLFFKVFIVESEMDPG